MIPGLGSKLVAFRKPLSGFLKLEISALGLDRNVNAKRHVLLSFIYKFINIIIQFILVPLLLTYLTPVKYGVWLTIVSIINWLNIFDIGIGNGLRLKLAEFSARNEGLPAKLYISTAYAILSLISFCLYLLLLILVKVLDWQTILNAPEELQPEINRALVVVFSFFFINMVMRLIVSLLYAYHKSSVADLLNALSNLLSLLCVFILMHTKEGSLVWVSFCIGFSTLLPLAIANYLVFKRYYPSIHPSINAIDLKVYKNLISLGFRYFLLQLSSVIVLSTDNILISQLFGPSQVPLYEIALKYFSIINIIFVMLLNPLWSAYTDAYTKGELLWIKNKITNLIYIWIAMISAIFVMVLLSEKIIEWWIGSQIKIPIRLVVYMAIYTIISTWNNIYAFFLNGIGKIQLSIYQGIAIALLNIPLSIYFSRYLGLGLSGIILGTISCLLLSSVIAPIQTYKIISCQASGIWSK